MHVAFGGEGAPAAVSPGIGEHEASRNPCYLLRAASTSSLAARGCRFCLLPVRGLWLFSLGRTQVSGRNQFNPILQVCGMRASNPRKARLVLSSTPNTTLATTLFVPQEAVPAIPEQPSPGVPPLFRKQPTQKMLCQIIKKQKRRTGPHQAPDATWHTQSYPRQTFLRSSPLQVFAA